MTKNNDTPTSAPVADDNARPLRRGNYILMAAAGAVIILGFLLMLGKGATETEFNPDIFSARRVVVGPTIAFLGYILMGVAIMVNPKRLGLR